MDTNLDEDEKLTMNRAAKTARSRRMDGVRRRTVPDEQHLLKENSQQSRPTSSVSAQEMEFVHPAADSSDLEFRDVMMDSPVFTSGDDKNLSKTPEQQSTIDETIHKDPSKEEKQCRCLMKKTAIKGLMILVMLVNTLTQIKNLILTGTRHRFYYIVLSINLISLTSQIVMGSFLFIILRIETKTDNKKDNHHYTELLHDIIIFVLIAVIALNLILSTFTVFVYDS